MIINIMFFTMECVKLSLALFGILNFKYKKKAVAPWVVLGVCMICLVIKGIQDNDYRISTFLYFSVIVCGLLAEGKRRFLWAFSSYLGICCVDELVYFVVEGMLSISSEMLDANSALVVGINSISVYLIVLVVWIVSKTRKKRGKTEVMLGGTSVVYLVLCTLGLFFMTFAMTLLQDIDFMDNWKKVRVTAGCICIFGVLFLLIWAMLIYNNNSKKVYKRMVEMNDKLLETQEKYYQVLLDKENETRRFRHDITNHILCVDVLLKEKEYQEAEHYLNDLKGALRELGPAVQTGNKLVNAILNDISQKYTEVAIDWEGHLPKKMQLPNSDICTLFSNILENAFFAAAGCEGEGKVSVKVQELGEALKIVVENNMQKPVEEKEGKLLTQKADKKNHGFGMMNVRDCVNRNGGKVEYSYTECNFTTKIVLSNGI
ncbi:MAG: GHKL domain-containing protein [Lachnospiraceae bacterium]|nr:GHKL domain-containing protein [Lachnospiraceae bacterium]